MKKIFVLFFLIMFVNISFASDYNMYETRQQYFDRKTNENYTNYQKNNYQTTLGGQSNSLNTRSGIQYGYNNYEPNRGMSINSYNHKNNRGMGGL